MDPMVPVQQMVDLVVEEVEKIQLLVVQLIILTLLDKVILVEREIVVVPMVVDVVAVALALQVQIIVLIPMVD